MKIAVVGGGPAGLRAAEVASAGGAAVTIFDAKPSVGRKFLVAGRGGLNLTKEESLDVFVGHYQGKDGSARWRELIADFGPKEMRSWAAGLGVETFAGTTGRVYPKELKAAPLLRSWVRRLREAGVKFEMGHRWEGVAVCEGGVETRFRAHRMEKVFTADAVILALGGGSWPQTGSDGAWTGSLQAVGVKVAALEPANCGWECNWPEAVISQCGGKPLKNLAVSAGGEYVEGELMVTDYGLEGGALYALGSVLRGMEKPEVSIDFKPSMTVESLMAKMGSVRKNHLEEARVRWRLSEGAFSILTHCTRAPIASTEELAAEVKNFTLPLTRPRPLTEAISSAGGVCWSELNEGLMLKRLPGVFAAGEMIDWEAPTGGYLLQGCFATGTRAGKAAIRWAGM